MLGWCSNCARLVLNLCSAGAQIVLGWCSNCARLVLTAGAQIVLGVLKLCAAGAQIVLGCCSNQLCLAGAQAVLFLWSLWCSFWSSFGPFLAQASCFSFFAIIFAVPLQSAALLFFFTVALEQQYNIVFRDASELAVCAAGVRRRSQKRRQVPCSTPACCSGSRREAGTETAWATARLRSSRSWRQSRQYGDLCRRLWADVCLGRRLPGRRAAPRRATAAGRYESWQRFSHRADLWRYIQLQEAGGSYIDIKMMMALLRPLTTTLADIYAEGKGSPYAVSSLTFCHADSGACMSYIRNGVRYFWIVGEL